MDRTDVSLIALRRILRATELYGRRLAHEAGLTAVQFRVMQVIAEKGHATPSEISHRMGVTQATMTSLIDKLVKKDMVTRAKSEKDRRVSIITITAAGHAAIDEAPDPLQQRYVRAFEALQPWEQAQLIASLERVAEMLDAGGLDASPVLDIGDLGSQ